MSAVDFVNAMWISADATEPDGVVDLTGSDSETDDEDIDMFNEEGQPDDKDLRRYAKIVVKVAALYGEPSRQLRETWANELHDLTKDLKKNDERNKVLSNAKTGGIGFHNSLGVTTATLGAKDFLTSIKEELLGAKVDKWTAKELYEYACSILNPNLGGGLTEGIKTFMKNEYDIRL